MAQPIIEVRGVSKDFLLPHVRRKTVKSHFVNMFRRRRIVEVQHALADIDFDVARGEFLGVVGRNGSGKSTLLKILAGIYIPSKGHVRIDGRLIPFIELGVGFNAELTGRENVYLNGAMMGFAKSEIDEIYDDIVAFAELEESMDQKLKNYSSGMQVRIAFSLATRARGDILLVDEVLAVGDAAFQRKCFEHFRALKNSDTTIIFVTHDMNAVREFCDRAILIEDSRILAEGAADDVAARYMQLFADTVHQAVPLSVGHADERWGDGPVRYSAVRVPEICADEPELIVELEAVAEQDVDEAAYGLMIRSSSGATIMGTNSLLKGQHCGGLRKGERAHVQWSVPNVFSDGLHYLDLVILDGSGFTAFDYWKQAASFTVVKGEITPYLVTLDTSFRFMRPDS